MKNTKQSLVINEELLKMLSLANNIDEIQQILKERGFNASTEEIRDLFKQLKNKMNREPMELKEEELNAVSGGVCVSAVLGGIATAVSIVSSLPKIINTVSKIFRKI